jgi:regulation of enolase protein 1 (concanavalin A-like superfamily)
MEHGGRDITLSYTNYLMADNIRFIKVEMFDRAGLLIRSSENRMIKKDLIPNQKELEKWENQD